MIWLYFSLHFKPCNPHIPSNLVVSFPLIVTARIQVRDSFTQSLPNCIFKIMAISSALESISIFPVFHPSYPTEPLFIFLLFLFCCEDRFCCNICSFGFHQSGNANLISCALCMSFNIMTAIFLQAALINTKQFNIFPF